MQPKHDLSTVPTESLLEEVFANRLGELKTEAQRAFLRGVCLLLLEQREAAGEDHGKIQEWLKMLGE